MAAGDGRHGEGGAGDRGQVEGTGGTTEGGRGGGGDEGLAQEVVRNGESLVQTPVLVQHHHRDGAGRDLLWLVAHVLRLLLLVNSILVRPQVLGGLLVAGGPSGGGGGGQVIRGPHLGGGGREFRLYELR